MPRSVLVTGAAVKFFLTIAEVIEKKTFPPEALNMIRPLATLAFAAAFLAAGALAPVAGVAESKTPLTGSDSRNVTVLEKNQAWPIRLAPCGVVRCADA
ncbi:MAG TPA: hypothetical protein VHK03_09530 [Aestuariivirgaceae bacterium]|jgi:hypothetical protein|nr:hypothetical protein [Aestuariivirgaceae bacterium]